MDRVRVRVRVRGVCILDRSHGNFEPPTQQQLNVKPPNHSASSRKHKLQSSSGSSRKHKLQRCSICANLGHKSRTCPVVFGRHTSRHDTDTVNYSRKLATAHARVRNNLDNISEAVRQASSSPLVRDAAVHSLLELAIRSPTRTSNDEPPPSHAVDEFPPPAAADVELYRSMVHQLQPVDDSAADAWPPTQHPNLSTDAEWMGPGVLSMLNQHFYSSYIHA